MLEYLENLPFKYTLNEEEKSIIVFIPSSDFYIKNQLHRNLQLLDRTFNIDVRYE